jgi:hypothetical protein
MFYELHTSKFSFSLILGLVTFVLLEALDPRFKLSNDRLEDISVFLLGVALKESSKLSSCLVSERIFRSRKISLGKLIKAYL